LSAEGFAVNERDIFHAAIELTDPAGRAAYLDEVCADNASLKRHVEEMLQVYPELGTFLESPAAALDRPPSSAGRFQLGAELARGGMGVIYSARDESLGRDVAVKVLHERYRADPLVGQRFVEEARITAQLQHPGIPPVFEVGRLDDGRPYLAMKLIQGRTLEALLKERPAPASDRGRFLAMFEQICQAVGYAHSKHILHRDLKPANVMVGAFGEVQVMDWGLAKVLQPGGTAAHEPAGDTQRTGGTIIRTARQSDSATLVGSMLGTPAFMAPEQAGGELGRLDERADVFGLGAILCVILTGAPPYGGKSGEAVRLMAIRAILADAHARLDCCGADARLVELCRACLSAQREGRPGDAGAVADAIHRYLAGVEERARQAEAKRAEALVREAEQHKRRRTVQVAGGVIAVVLLAGLGVSLGQMFRAIDAEGQANHSAEQARHERDAKELALQAEQKARDDETKARNQAFTALRSMTADVVERKFAQGAVLTEDDRDFLRGIIAQFDAFAAIKGDDADSRAVRAEGRFRVGLMRSRLGELQEAEQIYNEALAICRPLADEFPAEPQYRYLLAGIHRNRGNLLRATQPSEAAKDYEKALSIGKQLVDEFPKRPEFRLQLAGSYVARGYLQRDTGWPKKAEQDYDRAVSLQQQLIADFPKRPEVREDLVQCLNNRGNLLREMRRPTDALKDVETALSIGKRLVDDYPTRPEFRRDLANSHNNRGNLLRELLRRKEAESDFEEALSIKRQLAADFPAQPEFRRDLGRALNNRGSLLRDTSRLAEAEIDFDQALSIRKQLVADFPRQPELRHELAGTCVNRALLYQRQGNYAAAKRALLEGRPHHLAALKANPRQPSYRQFYRNHLGMLTVVHALLLEPKDAVRTAATRRDVGWDAPADATDAAGFLCLCIPIAAHHDKLNARLREEAVRFYTDAAIRFIHHAVSKGYRDVERLKKDNNLAPLRQREEFQKIVAELERQGK
jgi:tetratricopeptide (TPR) repeat protein/tRNA A-37 threonylcarbamoyl transferase component Bud32